MENQCFLVEENGVVVKKECSTCEEIKDTSDFYKSKILKVGLKSSCKKCEIERTRKWQKENPEKAKQILERTRAARYGITVEERDALFANGCAICGTHEKLHVDHDHSTGKVRAALCHYCNVGIGNFKDDPERLRKAIDYLSVHQGR